MKKILIIAGIGVIIIVSYYIGYNIGIIAGELNIYRQRYSIEEPQIRHLLSQNKDFCNLSIDNGSYMGIAFVEGNVPSSESYEYLKKRLTRLFGEKSAKQRIMGVTIKQVNKGPEKGTPITAAESRPGFEYIFSVPITLVCSILEVPAEAELGRAHCETGSGDAT
jgi:hypothetical protein